MNPRALCKSGGAGELSLHLFLRFLTVAFPSRIEPLLISSFTSVLIHAFQCSNSYKKLDVVEEYLCCTALIEDESVLATQRLQSCSVKRASCNSAGRGVAVHTSQI